MNALQQLIGIITNRANYKHHIVLDAGKLLILVLTTDAHLYTYDAGKWQELTPTEAKRISCNHYYQGEWELLEEIALSNTRL